MRSKGLLLLGLTLVGFPLLSEEVGVVNEISPSPGVLFGGQPTAEQLDALAASGYKTVLDLRGVNEDRGFDEAAVARRAGLTYLPVPVTGETMAQAETFDQFIRHFKQAEKPMLVHCASGGRVGALYYAWLVASEKMPREQALEEAKDNSHASDALFQRVDLFLDGKLE